MVSSNPVFSPAAPKASTLSAKLAAEQKGGLPYAGDISPEDAYSFLLSNTALMVDVRTLPEWQFTGVPDLTGTKGRLATISWKNYPDFSRNIRFAEELSKVSGINHATPLLFICRSGGRSLDAAVAMTAAGYHHCYNIEGGFEGEPDAEGHRGTQDGWKAKKLPWKQG